MSRYFSSIVILLLLASFGFAAEIPDPDVQPVMRSMTVGGTYNVSISAGVTPIISDVSAAEGTPFNMLGDDVVASAGYVGRKIAEWTLAANTNRVKMTVGADPLTGPHPDGNSTVDYVLYFYYSFPVYENVTGTATDEFQSGQFYIVSDGYEGRIMPGNGNDVTVQEGGSVTIETSNEQKILINGGEIRVFFPAGEMETIQNNSLTPPGTYSATVTINVWSE